MDTAIVYGIANCDVTRKALAWLKQNDIPFQFHDYRKAGISEALLNNWADVEGWQALLNKRGTTWKGIATTIQQSIIDKNAAIRLMLQFTSLVKRPVTVYNETVLIGYHPAKYAQLFAGR